MRPQHLTVESARRAQAWNCPALTATALLMPVTLTGVVRCEVVASPSWP
ncbi:MAG: hypothetical protein U0359_02595 [Byssovorax sp.]